MRRRSCGGGWMILVILLVSQFSLLADGPGPPGGLPLPLLEKWSFDDTNFWSSSSGYTPLSFTNLKSSNLGNGSALVLDSTNAAWLHYNAVENDGSTNLAVDSGSLMFWFAPNWSGANQGGTGPGTGCGCQFCSGCPP